MKYLAALICGAAMLAAPAGLWHRIASGAPPTANTPGLGSPTTSAVATTQPRRLSAQTANIHQHAIEAYHRALEAPLGSPAAAHYARLSLGGWLTLRESGIENAALETNIGDLYTYLGDHGRAVLHYRRAARLAPPPPPVRAALSRAQRLTEQAGALPGSASDASATKAKSPGAISGSIYNDLLPHSATLLRWAAFLIGLGWSLLLVRLLWRRRPLLWTGLGCATFGYLLCGVLLWQMYTNAAYPPAIVVQPAAALQAAPGDTQPVVLPESLPPGIELRILRSTRGWSEVELADGTRGWLPEDAVEPI